MTYLKNETAEIVVTLLVPVGDTCLINNSLHKGRCHHYRSRSCHVFNKVIVDHKKCDKCLEVMK